VEERRTTIRIDDSHRVPFVTLVTLLMAIIMAVMYLIVNINSLSDTFKETKTEVRILQMHVQDQNAILIRAGIKRPGDSTTGPTNPDKLEAKNYERDSL